MRKLTKLEVARRHIETAIELMFCGGDCVSTHTLLFAAGEVLRDLCKHRGIISTLDAGEELVIRPGKLGEWRRIFRLPATFLKHADRDPEAEIDEFTHEVNYGHAIFAIDRYLALEPTGTPIMTAFQNWFFAMHPELLHSLPPPIALFARIMDGLDEGARLIVGRLVWATACKKSDIAERELQLLFAVAPHAFMKLKRAS